jgi:hypothetical protein
VHRAVIEGVGMNVTSKLAAAIAVCLMLAGCAGSGPPPPTYGDAFKGLFNQSSASVPADAQVTVQQPLGIIFSDNVETWFDYVKRTSAYWATVVPSSLTNTVVLADTDPNFVGGRVLAMLKRRFPNSEYVKDFAQAVASGKKGAIVVDVLPKPMQPYGDRTTKFDISLYFFDAGMNPVSRMSGHGERYVPMGAGDAGIQAAVDGALSQLETKVDALVR